MTLGDLNRLDPSVRAEAMAKCCGATAWVQAMTLAFPFDTVESLYSSASAVWRSLDEAAWYEAFSHHTKIGDTKALAAKFASTAEWATGEQAAVGQATSEVIERLAKGNRLYEERFGYIFIVCATGKTAEEMVALLEARLLNPYEKEIFIAMGEQEKITRIRLEKLLDA